MRSDASDVNKMFENNGVELLYADVIHTQAFEACCACLPEFRDEFVDLTGNFYDDLEQAQLLLSFNRALFGDVVRGELDGFYSGNNALLMALFEDKQEFYQIVERYLRDPAYSLLWRHLKQQPTFNAKQRKYLVTISKLIHEEMNISKALFDLGCVRVGQWFEAHALELKLLLLSHLQEPSVDNNLTKFYLNIKERCCLSPAIKDVLLAFYHEKMSMPTCMDTSPLFTLIGSDDFSKLYPLFFTQQCMFDVNEKSSYPSRKDLSAFSYALQENKIDIAYALFQAKAQCGREEFARLIHLSIKQADPNYQFDNAGIISIETFSKMNALIDKVPKYKKRFRQLYESWLNNSSDNERQRLFCDALESELMPLALSLLDKPGVNVNAKAKTTGKNILHLAIEQKSIVAINKISALELFNFNQTDNNGFHVLQFSTDPILLAPVIYFMLRRSNDNVLSFLARKIHALLNCYDISPKHQDAVALINEVKQLILEPSLGNF